MRSGATPRRRSVSVAGTAAISAVLTMPMVLAAPTATAAAGPATYYVATSGSDSNPGTATRPFKSVAKAVTVVTPGDVVRVHAGTYIGVVTITRSGTASSPITVTAFGDGPVTLTETFRPRPCDAHTPAGERTLQIRNGADYWTFSGLDIHNGVYAKGVNASTAMHWFSHLVDIADVKTRRAVPGRGSYDPVAARSAWSYLSTKLNTKFDTSDGLRFLNDTVTGRGFQLVGARYGEIAGTTIHAIDCGIGPAVWINVYSDGWSLHDNHIYDVAASTYKHYMQEGIRLGSASAYNVIERNVIEDLPGDGRAFTTDVDASWNTYAHNTARNVEQGFNDQMSGWGNHWLYNTATQFRTYGFNFRGLDASLPQPSLHSSTYKAFVKCNSALGGPTDPAVGGSFHVGGMKASRFVNNSFTTAVLGDYELGYYYVRDYWGAQGNTWNGSPNPPPLHPPLPPAGAC